VQSSLNHQGIPPQIPEGYENREEYEFFIP